MISKLFNHKLPAIHTTALFVLSLALDQAPWGPNIPLRHDLIPYSTAIEETRLYIRMLRSNGIIKWSLANSWYLWFPFPLTYACIGPDKKVNYAMNVSLGLPSLFNNFPLQSCWGCLRQISSPYLNRGSAQNINIMWDCFWNLKSGLQGISWSLEVCQLQKAGSTWSVKVFCV